MAFAGTAALIALFGLGAGAGLTYSTQVNDTSQALDVLGASLLHVPSAWVLIAITLAALGLAPRQVAIGWAALAAFVLLGELGPLLKLSHWLLDLSPFTHTPKLPGGTFSATPLAALMAIAAALTAAGLAGLRRRDLT